MTTEMLDEKVLLKRVQKIELNILKAIDRIRIF